VRDFYDRFFIGTFPDDFEVRPLTRTVGAERLVDEIVVSFTHTCEIPIFLPGVAPTGRQVRVPLVVVVGFAEARCAPSTSTGIRRRSWCKPVFSNPTGCRCAASSSQMRWRSTGPTSGCSPVSAPSPLKLLRRSWARAGRSLSRRVL